MLRAVLVLFPLHARRIAAAGEHRAPCRAGDGSRLAVFQVFGAIVPSARLAGTAFGRALFPSDDMHGWWRKESGGQQGIIPFPCRPALMDTF